MAKRDYKWNVSKLERFLKEGRGTGEGEKYKPWLITQDYPSMGVATRIFSQKTNRMHHFFSKNQLFFFYILEYDENVIDIKEHYPLLDLQEELSECRQVNLNKYIGGEGKTPYILTTTFFISYKSIDGLIKYAARSVKNSSELVKKSVQNKLEIERRYWQAKEIPWSLVTNNDLNMIKVKNIEYIRDYVGGNEIFNLNTDAEDLVLCLYERIAISQKSIKDTISEYEMDYEISEGTGVTFFKFLLANKYVCIDMNSPINLNSKCSTLTLSISGRENANELFSQFSSSKR